MSLNAFKSINCLTRDPVSLIVRYAHHISGKRPGVALSLEKKLTERNWKDPNVYYKVDIGFTQPKVLRRKELPGKIAELKELRSDPKMEKLARTGQLQVSLDKVKEDWWQTIGPQQVRQIANHYAIFEHLFGDAYFTPIHKLDVAYPLTDDLEAPVYYGNIIKPAEAKREPRVHFSSKPDSLWTLALTNPDGHLTTRDAEYVHWLVGNIPGSNITEGETVWPYLQPFPARGTGYQRLIFVLYKQNQKLDFSALKKSPPCTKLSERSFSTLQFYRERQDHITPAGLCFFQSDWDASLTHFFHNTLQMKEPVFEYDFPPPYIRPQEWFPIRRPFNLYLDKYRDPKELAEQYLLKKLSQKHPFRRPTPPLRFPHAQPIPRSIPSWLALEIQKERLGWGRINDF